MLLGISVGNATARRNLLYNMLKVLNNSLISLEKEKIISLLVCGLLLFFVFFITLQATQFAVFLGILIGLLPLYYRKIFNFNTYLFFLIFSLILEKYSYYVGFSIRLPMLFITGTLFVLLIQSLIKGHFEVKYNQYYLILIILFLNYSLGAIWSINPVNVIRVSILYIFLFSLFLITIHVLNSEARMKCVLKYIVAVGIIGSLYGFYQIIAFVFGLPLRLPFTRYLKYHEIYNIGLTVFKLGNLRIPRINSTFNDPVLIGSFAGMSLMILCSQYCLLYVQNSLSTTKKLSFMLGFLILFSCVILTFSRSSWLGLFLGFVVLSLFLLKNDRTRKLMFKFFIVLLLIIVIVILVYPPFKEMTIGRVTQAFDFSNISTAGHWKWLKVAIHAWSESPLFGVGLNNFGEFYARNYQATTQAMAHSAYLSFLAETGIIGLILEMALIFTILRHFLLALSHAKKLRDDNFYLMLVGLVSAYIVMLGSNITYHFYTQFYVWFFNGISVAVSSYVLNQRLKTNGNFVQ